MAISSFYFRKSQKQWLDKKKDYSLQGRCLSNKNKFKTILNTQQNQQNANKNNFDSAFSGMNFKTNTITSKSMRKYLKCYSQLNSYQNSYHNSSCLLGSKKPNIKTQISEELKKVSTQRYLSSSLARRSQTSCELKNKRKIGTQRSQQKRVQNNEMQNEKNQIKKSLLQSTNVTLRSLSYLKSKNPQLQDKNNHIIARIQNKNTEKQIKNLILQSLSRQQNHDSIKRTIFQTQQNQQETIDIRLSLKSMAKSQQGQANLQKTLEQKLLMPKSVSNIKLKDDQLKNFSQRGKIFTSRVHKNNRMIIKFDKRLLLNAIQVNNPCLKINKITSSQSRN